MHGREVSPDTYRNPGAADQTYVPTPAAHAGLQPPVCRTISQRLRKKNGGRGSNDKWVDGWVGEVRVGV